jgi:hypothetical protein
MTKERINELIKDLKRKVEATVENGINDTANTKNDER